MRGDYARVAAENNENSFVATKLTTELDMAKENLYRLAVDLQVRCARARACVRACVPLF